MFETVANILYENVSKAHIDERIRLNKDHLANIMQSFDYSRQEDKTTCALYTDLAQRSRRMYQIPLLHTFMKRYEESLDNVTCSNNAVGQFHFRNYIDLGYFGIGRAKSGVFHMDDLQNQNGTIQLAKCDDSSLLQMGGSMIPDSCLDFLSSYVLGGACKRFVGA